MIICVEGKGVFELKGFRGAFSFFIIISSMKAKASFMSVYMEDAFFFLFKPKGDQKHENGIGVFRRAGL